MNKVIELAKQLGEALSGSDEFLRYKAADDAYHADEEALRLTEEYGKKHRNFHLNFQKRTSLLPK